MENGEMDSTSKYWIFDFAIQIRGEDEIQEFIKDPKDFLKRIGALDRTPEFNGFVNRNLENIDASEIASIFEEKSKTTLQGEVVTLDAMHLGVPWAQRYYCKYLVY